MWNKSVPSMKWLRLHGLVVWFLLWVTLKFAGGPVFESRWSPFIFCPLIVADGLGIDFHSHCPCARCLCCLAIVDLFFYPLASANKVFVSGFKRIKQCCHWWLFSKHLKDSSCTRHGAEERPKLPYFNLDGGIGHLLHLSDAVNAVKD